MIELDQVSSYRKGYSMTNQDKMTDEEFAGKVLWEGGPIDGLTYGLKSTDLADQDGELASTWRALELQWKAMGPVLIEAENLIEGLSEPE